MRTKHCCFAYCTSASRYSQENVSYIPFVKPYVDEVRCNKWIQASGRIDLTYEKLSKNSYVCSKHFIGGQGPTELNPDPVPTNFNKDEEPVLKDSPKKTSNKRHIPGILNRKTSNRKSQRNQSTDVNTSDVQPRKKHLRKTPLSSRSKPEPVKESNSKDSSINTSSNKVQKPQLLKLKSPSNRNIQKNKRVDDEFDIFAKRIAFQLRLLPYYNAVLCQEKIKRIINQERFIVQQPSHQEKETIIIKQEPGLSEEEFLYPVSSPETMQTIIKEELVISEDEYPNPVSCHGTMQTIINQESEKVLSHMVSGQETLINQSPAIRENEFSHPVSGQEKMHIIIKEEELVISEDEYPHPVSCHGTMQTKINQESAISEKVLSHTVSGQERIQTKICHKPPPVLSPFSVIKTENF